MEPEAVNGAGSPSAQGSLSEGAGAEILGILGGDEGEGEEVEFAEGDGEESEGGEEDGAEVENAEPGGEGDDRRSQHIPRTRFDEVLTERNALRTELAQLRQQATQPDPATREPANAEEAQAQEAAAFERWVRDELQVEDLYSLDQVQLRLAYREFQREGQAAQQQRTQTLTQIRNDFDALTTDFPELKAPRVRSAFLNDYGATHGVKADSAAMRKHAEEFSADLKTLGRNQLSEEALAAEAAARKRPNTSGGDPLGLGGDREWIEDLSPEGEERFQKEKRGIFNRLLGGRGK